jgi:hypothetical protein
MLHLGYLNARTFGFQMLVSLRARVRVVQWEAR